MLSLKTPVLFALLLVLGGCVPGLLFAVDDLQRAALARRVVSEAAADAPKTEFAVDKSFDRVWTDLTTLAALNSLPIDGYDKSSGSMTLRLDDSKYVECFPPFTDNDISNLRGTRHGYLTGEMRVAIEPLNDARTRVEIRADYYLNGHFLSTGEAVTHYFLKSNGVSSEKTCRPTHLAERTIVNGIKKEEAQLSRDELAATLRIESAKQPEDEGALRRSVAIREELLGKEHMEVARALNRLAGFYHVQGRYSEAEAPYERVLEIWEEALGPEHSDLAPVLDGLGAIYHELKRYPEAQATHRRALLLREKELGQEHVDLLPTLNDLGAIYREQQRFAEAYPIHLRVLTISNDSYGPNDRRVSSAFDRLVASAGQQFGEKNEESRLDLALEIAESALGVSHPIVDRTLGKREALFRNESREIEIENQYERALDIREDALGPRHPDLVTTLVKLAELYDREQRNTEFEDLYARALDIRDSGLGPEHRRMAKGFTTLANIYESRGEYAKADSLFEKALLVRVNALGPRHPDVIRNFHDMIDRLRSVSNHDAADERGDAIALHGRIVATWERVAPDSNPPAFFVGLYCYYRRTNDMLELRGKALCHSDGAVLATSAEHEEWKASKEAYKEKFRKREVAE